MLNENRFLGTFRGHNTRTTVSHVSQKFKMRYFRKMLRYWAFSVVTRKTTANCTIEENC